MRGDCGVARGGRERKSARFKFRLVCSRTFLLANSRSAEGFQSFNLIGRGALWVAVFTALWSMYDYFKMFFVENKKRKTLKERVFGEQKSAEAASSNK
jgi:hypothetical protein